MSKVTVYQYMALGTNLGEPRKARRWGTREAIEGLKGSAEILGDTATDVDASVGVHPTGLLSRPATYLKSAHLAIRAPRISGEHCGSVTVLCLAPWRVSEPRSPSGAGHFLSAWDGLSPCVIDCLLEDFYPKRFLQHAPVGKGRG